ncbi:hypothetical protein B9479_000561 [Cryptococcus floricola]|uniref:CN hydrolase domain-containing protein n=1 Tax=Cryptococcus floricola TaxID=2591691 RepID=A0A5D3B4N3_9TREE|nr:hypothetical protein B9479_000561 [Cryptococcus floricola]
MTQSKSPQTYRIAAVQAESAWLDLEAGVDKTCAIIKEAGEKGVDVVGFPETFIPGFPFSIYTSAPDQEFVLQYQKNSMVVGSPEYNKIRRAVRDAGIWAVVGFSERAGSTLYLAQSFINPQGEVAHHRRKLKPTHVERYLFGDGMAEDTKFTTTTDSGLVIGGMNCWEHLQPLWRYYEYAQGVQVHVASWPYLARAKPGVPNSSSAEVSGDCITRMAAVEGGCFTMACTATISKAGSEIMKVPTSLGGPAATPIEGGGFAAIYHPSGETIAQSKDEFSEELVIADIDLDDLHRHKQMADCVGHYSRPDLFHLVVNNETMPRVKLADGSNMHDVTKKILPLDD